MCLRDNINGLFKRYTTMSDSKFLRVTRALFFCGLMLLILASCMRGPEDIDLVKYMVVQTDYDTGEIDGSVNIFSTYNTFVLRQDTMGFVSTLEDDTILVDGFNFEGEFVTPVVDRVTQKVETAGTVGFQRVEEDQNPDFGVKIVVLQNFSFFQTVSYPGYYSGYYGYYGGYYGPVVNNYYSNFITLVIEVVDIKNYAANGNKYKVIWTAYIGDLGATLDLTGKTLEAVDQAFAQSPYFSKN